MRTEAKLGSRGARIGVRFDRQQISLIETFHTGILLKAQAAATGYEEAQATATGQEKKSAATGATSN